MAWINGTAIKDGEAAYRVFAMATSLEEEKYKNHNGGKRHAEGDHNTDNGRRFQGRPPC